MASFNAIVISKTMLSILDKEKNWLPYLEGYMEGLLSPVSGYSDEEKKFVEDIRRSVNEEKNRPSIKKRLHVYLEAVIFSYYGECDANGKRVHPVLQDNQELMVIDDEALEEIQELGKDLLEKRDNDGWIDDDDVNKLKKSSQYSNFQKMLMDELLSAIEDNDEFNERQREKAEKQGINTDENDEWAVGLITACGVVDDFAKTWKERRETTDAESLGIDELDKIHATHPLFHFDISLRKVKKENTAEEADDNDDANGGKIVITDEVSEEDEKYIY